MPAGSVKFLAFAAACVLAGIFGSSAVRGAAASAPRARSCAGPADAGCRRRIPDAWGEHAPSVTDKLARTLQKYGIDARSSLPPAPKGAFAIMEELRKMDERLDATDAMILAQVLLDPDSKFFTKDEKMLYNAAIKKYEQRLRSENIRNEKLKITERIGSS